VLFASSSSATLAQQTDSETDYYIRGLQDLDNDKPDDALEDYEQAIKIDSQLAQAYANRGIVRMEQGRYPEAISDMERAISLDE